MRDIHRVIIHCSDSDASGQDVAEITRWHKARGFLTCGYHYVILRDGTVEKGRPEKDVGAHVEGYNSDSIGICVVGREFFHWFQFRALYTLLYELGSRYPKAQLFGHRDFNKQKTCPNFGIDVFQAFWSALRETGGNPFGGNQK